MTEAERARLAHLSSRCGTDWSTVTELELKEFMDLMVKAGDLVLNEEGRYSLPEDASPS